MDTENQQEPPATKASSEAKSFLEDLKRDRGTSPNSPIESPVAAAQTPTPAPSTSASPASPDPEPKPEVNNINEDGIPNFSGRAPKAPKKSAEESHADLRKQRDELAKRSEGFTKIFGEADPSAVAPLMEYVTEIAGGVITPAAVVEAVNSIKAKDEEIKRLSQELEERETHVQRLDIRESKQFKEKFQKPYEEASETLFLEFANFGADKSVIGPASTQQFHEFLMNPEGVDGVSVKAAMTQFAAAYEKETGEKPNLPSVTSIMQSVRNFGSQREKLAHAYNNWKTVKAEEEQRSMIEQSSMTEAQQKANRKMRSEQATKAYQEFDLDKYPFLEESEVSSLFSEEFKYGDDIHAGKKVPGYNEFIARGVHARLWEKYGSQLSELIEWKAEQEKRVNSDIPGSTRVKAASSGSAASGASAWMGDLANRQY